MNNKNRLKLLVFLLVLMITIFFIPNPFSSKILFHNDEKIKILSLDGGGVRGVASLEVLEKIQRKTNINIYQSFDFFSGTSTGSIIAVFLALDRDIEDILKDYKELSKEAFSKKGIGLFHPKYKQENLKEILIRILNSMGFKENIVMGDLPKKVVIPTVCLSNSTTNTPSLYFYENITDLGKQEKIIDAILSATAAPTYFPSYQGKIDGGIGMNDPSLAALAYAFQAHKGMLKDFILFSVGTGYEKDGIKGDENWGALNWIFDLFGKTKSATPLLSIMFDINDQIPFEICSKILGSSYKRFNFSLDHSYPLDDYENIIKLINYTDDIINIEKSEWNEVCNWIVDNIKINKDPSKTTR